MNRMLNMYSVLQIVERMYNNCYRRVFWPAVVQIGIFALCISAALCVSKWNLISHDPRVFISLLGILNGLIGCVFYPYCASKTNTTSFAFLRSWPIEMSNTLMRKRILSKRAMRIYISDNFIDARFQLNVCTFCLNMIFSLIVILK